MACPLCGEQCRCSAAKAEDAHVSVLIDPESYEDSEQEFASTIDGAAGDDTALVHDLMGGVEGGAENDEPLGDLALGATGTPVVTPQLSNLAASSFVAPAVATMLIEAATTEPPPQFYRPPEPPVWRDEVTSKVDAYHAKRGRGRRYDPSSSLSLNFDSLPDAETALPARFAPVRLEVVEKVADTNLIVFPKPQPVTSVSATEMPLALPLADELADPISETPRILDVPEGTHALPQQPLAHIQLDEPQHDAALDCAANNVELELPLPVAPMGPRIGAGLIDILIVLTATAIFGMIFMMIAKELPQGRELAACALALPAVLWAAYHYLFLVRCATTPGMQIAQLGLAPFEDDKPITRNRRRARALAMSVSAMSMGMGFLWAYIDQDRLAWHDRISHTFLVND
ncbi:MAG: RDD family protein [Acidobacteriota bacterium]|nr:RDD family protein [Acidobacteriota bacterium]